MEGDGRPRIPRKSIHYLFFCFVLPILGEGRKFSTGNKMNQNWVVEMSQNYLYFLHVL